MKVEEKARAINLRKQGWSINSISREIKISKSTASVWLRNVKLTQDQEKKLFENVRVASVVAGRLNRDKWNDKKKKYGMNIVLH